MPKLTARLEPSLTSRIVAIWEVSSAQFEGNALGRQKTFYYIYPPFYKMVAVTDVGKNRMMHFRFDDERVPDCLKGEGETFTHMMVKTILREAKTLSISYDAKVHQLEFSELQEEFRITYDNSHYSIDLYGKIKGPSALIDLWGNYLGIEVYTTSKVKPPKLNAFRELGIPVVQLNMSWYNEPNLKGCTEPEPFKKIENALRKILQKTQSPKVLHLPEHKDKRYVERKQVTKAKNAQARQEATIRTIRNIPTIKMDLKIDNEVTASQNKHKHAIDLMPKNLPVMPNESSPGKTLIQKLGRWLGL